MAEIDCGIDYADTWSPKLAYWISKSKSMHCSDSDYRCEGTLEVNTAVAQACQHITGIHKWVAPKSRIQWLLATFQYSRWLDHCELSHGGLEAMLILDPVDVEEAYSHIALCHHSMQWQVRSHGWCDASCVQEVNGMEGRLVLCCEVSSTEVVQILSCSDSNNGHASHFCTYPRCFPEVAIISKVEQGNGY